MFAKRIRCVVGDGGMQSNLFGETKDALSITRIRELEPEEGYYLSFSGGKDSTVLYDLTERAGVKFDAHYQVTGIDPPEVVRFITENYPDVIFEKPEKSFHSLIESKGLPTRTARWCCRLLKEKKGAGRLILTGVRAEESPSRAKYGLVRNCQKMNTTLISPILDWTTDEIWSYIEERGLEYCCLYDEGFDRIGCVPCPFLSTQEKLERKKRWPKIFERIRKAAQKAWDNMPSVKDRWENGDDFFDWWLNRDAPYPSTKDDQRSLFS